MSDTDRLNQALKTVVQLTGQCATLRSRIKELEREIEGMHEEAAEIDI